MTKDISSKRYKEAIIEKIERVKYQEVLNDILDQIEEPKEVKLIDPKNIKIQDLVRRER